jgi:4-hydroxybenzoate polyprenyltransferase
MCLMLSALCFSATGLLYSADASALHAADVIAVTVLLHFLVYGLNRIVDESELRRLGGGATSERGIATSLFLLLALLLFCAAIAYLPPMSRFCSVAILVIGGFYSLGPRSSATGGLCRLKSLFVGKNLVIGLGRALLIVVGCGTVKPPLPLIAAFSCLQVFIGSVLRDFADVDEDRSTHVRTLPVILGERGAIRALRLTNVAGGAALLGAAAVVGERALAVGLIGAVAVRALTAGGPIVGRTLPRFPVAVGNFATYAMIFLACWATGRVGGS